MKITKQQLEQLGACTEALGEFYEIFGDTVYEGVEITVGNIELANESYNLDIAWLLSKMPAEMATCRDVLLAASEGWIVAIHLDDCKPSDETRNAICDGLEALWYAMEVDQCYHPHTWAMSKVYSFGVAAQYISVVRGVPQSAL